MKPLYKYNLNFLLLSLFVLAIAALLPFCVYDQDGYYLWFPIVGEFLAGENHYHASEVIFSGQNLAAIYGKLPFWRVLQFLDLPVHTFLNVTHAVYVIMFASLIAVFIAGKKQQRLPADIYFAFLIALFSPVVTNRVMAGHFNLLYGMLPFFFLLGLFFNKTYGYMIWGVLCVWCALSNQAYQILSYHIFYLPLWIYLFIKVEKDKKRYLVSAIVAMIAAFALNYPLFHEMLSHATSSENARSLGTNMVFTYLVTLPSDFLQLILSTPYESWLSRPLGFYHELSYPMGAFFLMMMLEKKHRPLSFVVLSLGAFFFLFTMNLPGLSLISELPLLKPFRVPQRLFMLLALFVPVWCYASENESYSSKNYSLFALGVFVSLFSDFVDLLMVAATVFCLYKVEFRKYALLTATIGLVAGSGHKLINSSQLQAQYDVVSSALSPLKNKYSAKELREKKFHFESSQFQMVNMVAQTMGIASLEGYGHPPKKLLTQFEQVTKLKLSPFTNSYYFVGLPDAKLKELGVDTVVSFGSNNELITQDL